MRAVQCDRGIHFYTALTVAIVVAMVLVVVLIGEGPIPPSALVGLLRGDNSLYVEIARIRLERAVAGIAVGGSLALGGVALQAISRNPLASPFTLGVSQAASFGATLAIVYLYGARLGSSGFVSSLTILNPYLVSLSSFAAAILAIIIVYAISTRLGMTASGVVLAGISIGLLFQAFTMLVEYLAPSEVIVTEALFWLFGDISRASSSGIQIMLASTLVLSLYMMYNWMSFNALQLGDEFASSVGIDVRRTRGYTIILVALATAATVAFVGVIGFVGLLAPHIARQISGSNHKCLMPASLTIGSGLVVFADEASRILLAPNTLPVGVTLAIIGAPALIALLTRRGETVGAA